MLHTEAWSQTAQRIVSLAPSLTKNLYFLGAQDQLIACTSYCTEALADNKTVVASAIKVNIEKTLSLHPDVVLVTTITAPETIEMLQKLGLRVEVFPNPLNFKEIGEQFVRMGKITGHENKAIEIVTESQQKVENLMKQLDRHKHPAIFFQIGADPLFTVLTGTFMNDYITFAGGRNIAADLQHGTMTRESVLVRNPEYIFVVTMGITGQEEVQQWKQYRDLAAAKTGKIFIVDAEKACSPTPLTFTETFETIVNLMHEKP